MNVNKELHILNQSLNALREEMYAFNMQMRIRMYSVAERIDTLNEVLRTDVEGKQAKENEAGVIETTK